MQINRCKTTGQLKSRKKTKSQDIRRRRKHDKVNRIEEKMKKKYFNFPTFKYDIYVENILKKSLFDMRELPLRCSSVVVY